MFDPKEAWDLILDQAVKAIERGMMWSDNFGGSYYSIIQTAPEFIQFKKERKSWDSARSLTPQQVVEAAEMNQINHTRT